MKALHGKTNSWRLAKGIIFFVLMLGITLTLLNQPLTIGYAEYSHVFDKIVNRSDRSDDNANDTAGGGDPRDHSKPLETDDAESSISPYDDTYRYSTPIKASDRPPYPTDDCGSKPNFSTFFSQTSNLRSYVNEDKIIYEAFFKQHIARGNIFNGTYVELGALNGMRYSDTRFFDQCLGWDGLLIESDPKMFDTLNINRPNAHQMNFAPLCLEAGEKIQLTPAASTSRFVRHAMKSYDKANMNVNVPCGPLGPVLEDVFADHGMHINFFALDMEGSEDVVLKTIDFKKVQIDVMMVGLKNDDCTQYGKCNVRDNVRTIMEKAGYTRHDGIFFSESLDLYVHKRSKFQVDAAKEGYLPPPDIESSDNLQSLTGYHKLPNIQMIGVGRAGTTAVSEWLYGQSMNSASGVCNPAVLAGEPSFFSKETHFFDHPDRYSKGIEFYAKHFESCGKHRFAMDATPDTFRHPKNVHDTYHRAGGTQHNELKIILILREPGSREFSLYNHMLKEYLLKPSRDEWYGAIESKVAGSAMSFDEYVGKVLEQDLAQINDLPMSFYSHNLGEWMKYFTRDQILIISYDEVREGPIWAQHRIRRFLGSDFPGELNTASLNETPTKLEGQMTCTTQTKLNMIFEAMTGKLYSFLDQNPGLEMEQRPFPKFRPPLCAEMYRGKDGEYIKYYKLPNIQMIGAPKAGTSAISEWLFDQPTISPNAVCRPAVYDKEPEHYIKEVHFFDHDDRYSQGIEFYAERFCDCGQHKYAMDATPDTLRHPELVSDTYHKAGGSQHAELKIILIVRDPVSRELSLYNHMVVEYQLHRARDEWYSVIAAEDGSIMTFDEYVKSYTVPLITSINERNMTFYPNNISEWSKFFKRKQLLVLSYDEVHLEPNKAQDRIREFIGSEFPGELPVSNVNKSTSKVREMHCSTRDMLIELFKPQVKGLYDSLIANPGPDAEEVPMRTIKKASCTP